MCVRVDQLPLFPYIRDGHQPNSRGENIPIIRIPTKGGTTIPKIATFDHGTCVFLFPAPGLLKPQKR